MYESYAFLRPLVIFAGAIGIFQSLAWISLSIVGLVAYYCNLDFVGMVPSYGTITEITLFRLYFNGPCYQPGLPIVDMSVLNNLNLMTPGGVHAWMWVYLFVSVFWAISSITLITVVTHRYIKIANIFLYIWIFITVALSLMDLAFGILFALDYNDIMFLAHQTPTTDVAGQFVLISAQTASGAMLTIAFRGFILWIINVSLAIYLFAQTFNIFDYNKFQPAEPIGTTNRAFVKDEKSHPIDAFGNRNQPNLWLAPSADQRRTGTALYEDRKRHYENQPLPNNRPANSTFYPPPRSRDDEIELRRDNNNARLVRELSHRNSRPAVRDEPGVPAPDYSPQMPRSNPYDASPLRPTQKQPSRY
ncbi:hypothetical protein Bhyg_07420 [Pseudolycoriella hygida]|uniref:Uncharacterized protein n=1 Tax=Pseudolycoriella hygida TaxID=35572 RepID=A0A9Q0N2K3_9DIPT|nr:hypothetical protein Bhyg_07420 [Pseudolycoriella hygida]